MNSVLETILIMPLYLLTYLLTHSMQQNLFWEANRFWVEKFTAVYATRRFITAFTRPRHLSLSWARSIQSMPPPPPFHILKSHLNIILPSTPGSTMWSLSYFPTKILYAPLLSPIRATCPTHLFLLDLVTRIIFCEEHRALSFSLCSFLHSLLPHSS
jgi:hypothetical protein